ncbi:MAG: A/G-specific adenine glycosylase [Thermoleophilia bacterium]
MSASGPATSTPEQPTPSIEGHSVSEQILASFRRAVRDHFRLHGRDLPWRRTWDPYKILVSEIMLQQTQVSRVLPKYQEFLTRFPDIYSLAEAPTAAVLETWLGLGYNRRALNLQRTAQTVTAVHGGSLPRSPVILRTLPGIGPATAAAIAAFAYQIAVPFIETNIRSAFLHVFFPDRHQVPDADILPLVEATLDRKDPRTWYYALMDYGAWLKKIGVNPSRASKHHSRQTPFAGSRRQLRSQIIRLFLLRTEWQDNLQTPTLSLFASGPPSTGNADAKRPLTLDAEGVVELLPAWDPEEVRTALRLLVDEGFLDHEAGYRLASIARSS